MQTFTYETGRAINAVAAANVHFAEQAEGLFTLANFPTPFTADQLTHLGTERGLIPTTDRAYGAVILRAMRSGLIEKTGEWRLATYASKRGHTSNRMMPVYRVVG